MLETPQVSWWYSTTVGTLTTIVSDNPQVTRTISREVLSRPVSQPDAMTPQRLHADAPILSGEFQAYLQGALHDGTFNRLHKTHRISQKGSDWLTRLQFVLRLLGYSSWIYREGHDREEMYALETKADFLNVDFDPVSLAASGERIAYVRGYFDAEGGLPRSLDVKPFQIQYVQKDRVELTKVRDILVGLGINCGKMHNPSVKVDPDYWRFFISIPCNTLFARCIGSWHPRKEHLLGMMI
jgi:hypothetical protein